MVAGGRECPTIMSLLIINEIYFVIHKTRRCGGTKLNENKKKNPMKIHLLAFLSANILTSSEVSEFRAMAFSILYVPCDTVDFR